jgi:hypothetical protein
MTDQKPRHEISLKRVVYEIPGMDIVRIQRDVEYGNTGAGALTMDLYHPSDARIDTPVPAVVLVAGYPDAGFERFVGCRFKEMASSVSWAQLMAASGLIAITYTNQEPASDFRALLRYVREHAAALGVDSKRVGLWASSGNVPLALSALMQDADEEATCAALCYGLMLDLDGSTDVAGAAAKFGFVNPTAGRSVADLRPDRPIFIARAGRDEMPGLNAALDRFVVHALAQNLPVTLVNHPTAPHAFDILDDSETSRAVIRQVLAFLQRHLLGPS